MVAVGRVSSDCNVYHKFRQTKQEVNESLDTYYRKLKQLAKYCEFDIEKEKKSQIIQACLSNKVRREVLRDSGITLQQILDGCY